MRFLLDTNACVDLIHGRNERILCGIQRLAPDDLCVSSVTLSELAYGAAQSADPRKNRLARAELMTPLNVMPYDDTVAPVYGRARAALERRGTPIGPLDTLIAAHALSLGLTVVTGNSREFRRVHGLKIQNWAV